MIFLKLIQLYTIQLHVGFLILSLYQYVSTLCLMSNRLTEQKQYEPPEGQLQKEDTHESLGT